MRDDAATGERYEAHMKTLAFVAMVALLIAGAPAYAQMAIS